MICKKGVIVLIIVLLLCIIIHAQEPCNPAFEDCPDEDVDYESEDTWQDPNNYGAATSSQVGYALQNGWISAGNIQHLTVDQLRANLNNLDAPHINGLTQTQIMGFTGPEVSNIYYSMQTNRYQELTSPQLTHLMDNGMIFNNPSGFNPQDYNANALNSAWQQHYNNPGLYVNVGTAGNVGMTRTATQTGNHDVMNIDGNTIYLDTFNLYDHSISSAGSQWIIIDDVMFKNVKNLMRSDRNCNNDNCLNADSAEEIRIPNARGRAEAQVSKDITIDSDHEYYLSEVQLLDDNGIVLKDGKEITSANTLFFAGESSSFDVLSISSVRNFNTTYLYDTAFLTDLGGLITTDQDILPSVRDFEYYFGEDIDGERYDMVCNKDNNQILLHNHLPGSGREILIDCDKDGVINASLSEQETNLMIDEKSTITIKTDNTRKIEFNPNKTIPNLSSVMRIIAAPTPNYYFLNGIMKYQNNNIKEEINVGDALNSVEIDLNFGFKCMQLSRNAIYYYYGDDYSTFSIRNPSYNPEEHYSICLKKADGDLLGGESQVDFLQKQMFFKGYAEANKFVFAPSKEIISHLLLPIYQGYSDNRIGMQFDNELHFVENSYATGERTSNSSMINSGYFTIFERDHRYVRVNQAPYSSAIKSYSASYDDSQIIIGYDLIQYKDNYVRVIREDNNKQQYERWLADG
ncbi:hypothetical protein JW968_02625 [Candidatus Woesearchaeota archaeon]|nr:hypothetical protein [Candidatus Woesearchaeota archaeon]